MGDQLNKNMDNRVSLPILLTPLIPQFVFKGCLLTLTIICLICIFKEYCIYYLPLLGFEDSLIVCIHSFIQPPVNPRFVIDSENMKITKLYFCSLTGESG